MFKKLPILQENLIKVFFDKSIGNVFDFSMPMITHHSQKLNTPCA